MRCYHPVCPADLLTSNVQAQTNPKADFEKAIIEEFCDSFAKAVPRLTRENWTGEIGMMIVPLFKKYESEIQAQWNFDTKDMSQYRSIGEKVGQLATLNCVAFQNYLKTNLNDVNAVVDGETGGRKMFSGKTAPGGRQSVCLCAGTKQPGQN
jgi:hypothetical protein